MKIVSLEARKVRVRLKRPVKHASHSRTETENVVVVCKLADGTLGYGEGVPRDYVTGETIERSISLLQATDWAGQLRPTADFADAVAMTERLAVQPVEGDDRKCLGNAARCALELAVLDAYGRFYGEPLMNVVKLLAPQLYEPREKVQYSGVILSGKPIKIRLLAAAYRFLGFKHVKVKVGVEGQNDVKRLKAIRRWAGKQIALRIDANESWAAADAAERIRELEPYTLASVEQPIRHEDVHALAGIRKAIRTPVMLDESLCGMVDAERAVEGKTCDLFNIRLSKCGGFIPSLRLAEYAVKHGLGYQLGCQVGETGILSAAGRQFASAVKNLFAVEGSFDKRLVEDALTQEDLTFSKNGGWAPMLPGCGLSARIDPDRLDAVTVGREVLLGG
jgi:muconate cycloisomerase